MAGQINDDWYNPQHFYHETPMRVRFGDVDALGHVNNAKYFTYIEHGRTRYFMDILDWNGDMSRLGVILAKASIDFKAPLFFDEQIMVYTRISRLGNKSFDMLYLIRRLKDKQPDTIVASGITHMVAFDYTNQQTQPIPEVWRKKIQQFEKAL